MMTQASELLTALYRRDMNQVLELRSQRASIDIFEASALGETDEARRLLDTDPALVNAFAIDGFTPLQLASFFAHEPVVAVLLERGADPNAVSRNASKLRALHSAAAARHVGIAERLLAAGAQIGARQEGGFTAMDEAVHHADRAMIDLLKRFGDGQVQ